MNNVSNIFLRTQDLVFRIFLHFPNDLLDFLLRFHNVGKTCNKILQKMLLVRILFRLDFYLRSILNGSKSRPVRVMLFFMLLIHLIRSVSFIAGVVNLLLSFFVGASLSLDISQQLPKSLKKLPCISAKLPMLKDVLVELVSNLVEIVHVELPHKRREIFMSEIDGKDLLLETLKVENGEMRSLFVPANDVGVDLVLNDKRCTSRIS